MGGNRNRINLEQTDPFRISNSDGPGIGEFVLGKGNAFAQDAPLLFDRPLRCQRQKLLHLVDGYLSIHGFGKSKNPAEYFEILLGWKEPETAGAGSDSLSQTARLTAD